MEKGAYMANKVIITIVDRPSGWVHLVLNFCGNSTVVYHDGIRQNDTEQLVTNINPGDGRIVIGRRYSGLDEAYSSVQVDEVLFFNEALTDDEIKMLSNVTTN